LFRALACSVLASIDNILETEVQAALERRSKVFVASRRRCRRLMSILEGSGSSVCGNWGGSAIWLIRFCRSCTLSALLFESILICVQVSVYVIACVENEMW
jgi:hypothetical protein